MVIYVGGNKINQIYIGDEYTIRQVYYGRYLVWELEYNYKSNVPASKDVYLTPGIYEIYAVGGGGGSAATGGGGGSSIGSQTKQPVAGEANP